MYVLNVNDYGWLTNAKIKWKFYLKKAVHLQGYHNKVFLWETKNIYFYGEPTLLVDYD